MLLLSSLIFTPQLTAICYTSPQPSTPPLYYFTKAVLCRVVVTSKCLNSVDIFAQFTKHSCLKISTSLAPLTSLSPVHPCNSVLYFLTFHGLPPPPSSLKSDTIQGFYHYVAIPVPTHTLSSRDLIHSLNYPLSSNVSKITLSYPFPFKFPYLTVCWTPLYGNLRDIADSLCPNSNSPLIILPCP